MRDSYDGTYQHPMRDSYDGHMRSAQAGLRASKWVFLVGDEEDRACREALSRDRIWFKRPYTVNVERSRRTSSSRSFSHFKHKTLLYFIYTFRVVCESERLLRGDRGAHGSRHRDRANRKHSKHDSREKKCVCCLSTLSRACRGAGARGRGGRGRLDTLVSLDRQRHLSTVRSGYFLFANIVS